MPTQNCSSKRILWKRICTFSRRGCFMQPWQIAVLVIGLFIIAGLAWVYLDTHRRRRLQSRFGPEYQRAVSEIGDRRRAETELSRREQRLRRLNIRPLTAEDRARFESQWETIQ